MGAWTKDRVPNEPLRAEFVKARERGVTTGRVCRMLAEECDSRFMRGYSSRPDMTADTALLERILGLRAKCPGKTQVTLRVDHARAICWAIGAVFDEVYAGHEIVYSEPARCACGEEMVKDAVMCGFCESERETMAA